MSVANGLTRTRESSVKLNRVNMPKENLNPEGDEPKDPLNQEEEESGDDDLELDFEESEDEPLDEEEPKDKPVVKADDALAAYNAEMKARGLNYNFKSWDDVYKSNKNAQDIISKKGMSEKKDEVVTPVEKVEVVPTNMSERLLKVEQPESRFVIDDIKKDHPGKDVYEVWEKSEYYRKEAQARAEAEKAKLRIAAPSGGAEGQPEVDAVEQKFISNLPAKYKK